MSPQIRGRVPVGVFVVASKRRSRATCSQSFGSVLTTRQRAAQVALDTAIELVLDEHPDLSKEDLVGMAVSDVFALLQELEPQEPIVLTSVFPRCSDQEFSIEGVRIA